jgi:hypothetical protein
MAVPRRCQLRPGRTLRVTQPETLTWLSDSSHPHSSVGNRCEHGDVQRD